MPNIESKVSKQNLKIIEEKKTLEKKKLQLEN